MREKIDSMTLRSMFVTGSQYLSDKKEWINELNVFPVPDGDTGTNMTLTLMAAVREIQKLPEDATMDEVGSRIASGTLRGARGNSGVIMSQLCRGFTKGIEGLNAIDARALAQGFEKAVATAYKAVMKPKEGTILTVARAAAEKATKLCKSDLSLEEFLTEILACAEETLQKTPELLAVLKEAGVVDSGGQGLVEFLRGARDAFLGVESVPVITQQKPEALPEPAPAPAYQRIDTSNIETSEIRFVYCTEFIIELERAITEDEEIRFKDFLQTMGDSIVCVSMDEIVKVHVHTNHPGQVIEEALLLGQLTSLKIDNMRIEHNEKVILEEDRALQQQKAAEDLPLKEYGFVAVCSGDGLAQIFRDLQVDQIIEGGQTMNPSTDDILSALTALHASNIFVLPNNGNIILAANQARDLCTDKNVIVIPTGNVCQGISAMIGFVPEESPENNAKQMIAAASQTRSGEVTYAVRNTRIGGSRIRKGDYMGIGGGDLLSVSKDLDQTVLDMINKLAEDGAGLVTMYYGEDISEEEAEALASRVMEALPDAEVEVLYGGQSIYNYIVSVE